MHAAEELAAPQRVWMPLLGGSGQGLCAFTEAPDLPNHAFVFWGVFLLGFRMTGDDFKISY